jgi:hypothetical protein
MSWAWRAGPGPGIAVLLGNLEVVGRSQEMRFCGSCHEPMAPLVASVIEANGSLASNHYQSGAIQGKTACYTCHSGYGLQGDLKAKRADCATCGTSTGAATIPDRHEPTLRHRRVSRLPPARPEVSRGAFSQRSGYTEAARLG